MTCTINSIIIEITTEAKKLFRSQRISAIFVMNFIDIVPTYVCIWCMNKIYVCVMLKALVNCNVYVFQYISCCYALCYVFSTHRFYDSYIHGSSSHKNVDSHLDFGIRNKCARATTTTMTVMTNELEHSTVKHHQQTYWTVWMKEWMRKKFDYTKNQDVALFYWAIGFFFGYLPYAMHANQANQIIFFYCYFLSYRICIWISDISSYCTKQKGIKQTKNPNKMQMIFDAIELVDMNIWFYDKYSYFLPICLYNSMHLNLFKE